MQELTAEELADRVSRLFFEDAPIGIAVTAVDGSCRRANTMLAGMLGYSVEELTATSLVTLTHPDDLAKTHDAKQRLLEDRPNSVEVEKRLCAKDGRYVWFSITYTLQLDRAGGPELTKYFLDITERKQREHALRHSEERYRRLFETAHDGILIVEPQTGRIVEANPFMTTLTGRARAELVGTLLWNIGPVFDTAASKEQFAALKAHGHVRYEDMPLRTRDGREVPVEFISNVYLVDGKDVIQCNIREISERKLAAEALRLRDRAIDAVAQGIVITDALQEDEPIIYASLGFTRITGYAGEDVVGRNCRFMQGVGTQEEPVARLRQAIQRGDSCTEELLNYRKDGTEFWNSISLSPIKDAKGIVTHFVGVQSDVTARRKLEAQLSQAQRMEAVGRLAGGVAHDFNNLLSVILSYAELAGSDISPDDPVQTDLAAIQKAALGAAELTKQLLTFSRQQVVETRVLSLTKCIVGMEKMLRRLLGSDIELTILPALAPGNVKADPSQVEQIIMNLAVNARDAMPQGGKLTIETANVELDEAYAGLHLDVQPGAYVMLAVTDNGAGMDAETSKRIFEPFFTTKERGKGTGLGLAMVFGCVKHSGGHIFVYSEPETGTTFKMFFPRVGGAIEARPSALPVLEPETESGTILLVEDDDQVRLLARNILRRRGYVVLEAPNGGEALLICEQHPGNIDLLLTDVVLPRMSGRLLAERLVPSRPTMKVLYMSGYTDDAILQHGIINSGVAFLQKPFTPTTMARKVREVLQMARLSR